MLKVRRFVLGMDEADWVEVRNAVYGVYLDVARITVEEMRVKARAKARKTGEAMSSWN